MEESMASQKRKQRESSSEEPSPPKKLKISEDPSLVINEEYYEEIVEKIKEKNSPEKKQQIVDDDDDEVVVKAKEDPSLIEQEKNFLSTDKPAVRSLEEIDTSSAHNIILDATDLKEKSLALHKCLVGFVFYLRNKATMDELFSRPGKTLQLGLSSFQGKGLRNQYHFQADAVIAIEIFNRICEGEMKLKLLKLIKANTGLNGGFVSYLTFSALDVISGKSAIYQAALHFNDEIKLGLFRDYSNDKILAYLSLIGAEESWAVLQSVVEYCVQEIQKYKESDY